MIATSMASNVRQILLVLSAAVALATLAGCGARGGEESSAGDEASGDKTYTIRLSHVSVPTSAHGQGVELFKKKVEEKSGGRLKVQIFPTSTLYGQEDEMQALQSGSVEMVSPTTASGTSVSPRFFLFDLPFVFRSDEDIPTLLSRDNPIGQAVLYDNPDLGKRNMSVVGLTYSGFKQLTSNKQMKTPDDMSGLKMRVQPSDVLRGQMKAWGANAVALPFSELYNALQQRVVDGQENPYTSILSTKVNEVQRNLTETNHGYNLTPLMINSTFLESLPEDLQQVVIEAGQETSEEALEIAEQVNVKAKQSIEETGKTAVYTPTDQELQAWRDEVVPSVWDEFAARIGPEIVSQLKQYHGN